jgi:NADH-quinone oxidoreductase subunit H
VTDFLWGAVRAVAIFGALMNLVPLLVWGERRVSAWIQNRVGPNRLGPMGLIQPVADVIKLLFKEEIVPARADKVLYALGPLLAFVPAAIAFSAIPVGRGLAVVDMSVGVLFVITASSLGVYGISFGGWASNNKFSLLGGLRSSAQIISYEIAMGLALVSVLMTTGSLSLHEIAASQESFWRWNVFRQPIAFVIFFTAAFAENNRLPFDLPECESELIGGYHTEYSGMKFGMYFLAEYIAMIVMSGMVVTLFLGGWSPGFALPEGALWTAVSVGVFSIKVLAILFVYIWVRWTLPRFRYDQLMRLGWKGLVPLAMANIVLTGIVVTIWDMVRKAG